MAIIVTAYEMATCIVAPVDNCIEGDGELEKGRKREMKSRRRETVRVPSSEQREYNHGIG